MPGTHIGVEILLLLQFDKQNQSQTKLWIVLLCDRRIARRVKEKVYKMLLRPAMMIFSLEIVALPKDKRQTCAEDG